MRKSEGKKTEVGKVETEVGSWTRRRPIKQDYGAAMMRKVEKVEGEKVRPKEEVEKKG